MAEKNSEEQEKNSGNEETIPMPKKVLTDYVKQINASIQKIHEEVKAQRKELEEQKKRPLKYYVEELSQEMRDRLLEKIRTGEANAVLAEILPEEIRKQEKVITALTIEEITKQAPGIVKEAVEKADLGQRVVDVINELDGVQPAGIEETIQRRQKEKSKRRLRNRILGAAGGLVVAGSLLLGGWAAYDSSRRTAEGAAGTANDAKDIAKKTDREFKNFADKYEQWKKSCDEQRKKDEEARKKEISGL